MPTPPDRERFQVERVIDGQPPRQPGMSGEGHSVEQGDDRLTFRRCSCHEVRSAFTFEVPPGVDARAWPTTAAVLDDWYIKPDAGLLLGSPANADPVPPHDVQPEELDIARAIDAIQRDTTLAIRRPRRT